MKSEILQSIRTQIGEEHLFHANIFRKGQCSVNLTNVSEEDRVIVDLDSVFPDGRDGENQCECILFYFDLSSKFVVIPIELKGGKAEVHKAVKQLKGGVDFAVGYIPKNVETICIPILLHNGISSFEVRQLKKPKSRIVFKGDSSDIKTAKRGAKLAVLLPKTLY